MIESGNVGQVFADQLQDNGMKDKYVLPLPLSSAIDSSDSHTLLACLLASRSQSQAGARVYS